MKLTKKIAAAGAVAVVLSSLVACQPGSDAPDDSAAASTGEFPESWENEITIDVFDGLANYQGIQQGWFAKLVKDKFNMKLNIIAPNVAGGGDTLYNTRVGAGDLGDLIITDKGQKLDELTEGGLLLDATPYYEAMTNVAEFSAAVDSLKSEDGGIYAFPSSVSSLLPTQPSEGLEPTFGAYLRWDLYEGVGTPAIGTLEDLLPVFAAMQEAEPTAPNGKPTYPVSLFKDWDGNMMNNVKQPITYYGYDELGFALAKADGSDYQGLLDDEGMYQRVLQFFFDANQMGLVDPESTTQNYDTLFAKFQNGQVLYSFWPWLGQSAYNTEDNTSEGRGFMLAEIEDQEIFSYGAEVFGGKQILAIGSKAEDPERIAAFIDWLYSPEGASTNSSQTMGAPGPIDLTWQLGDGDAPELTDFGKEVFLGGDSTVPEEWGGGSYIDGSSTLNLNVVLPTSEDPRTGAPYNYTMWPSFAPLVETPLSESWRAAMGDAPSTMEFLESKDQLLVAPGASFTNPTDSSQIETLRNQVKAIIVQTSWQMVFAKDQAEFDSLWSNLQSTAPGLGYDDVLAVDMAAAEEQNAAREAVAAEFG